MHADEAPKITFYTNMKYICIANMKWYTKHKKEDQRIKGLLHSGFNLIPNFLHFNIIFTYYKKDLYPKLLSIN